MKNLRELASYASLQEISASLAATVGDGETAPEAVPEGEREFVKLHKTARRKDPYGNKGSEAVKQYTFKEKPKPGFPPEVKEERDNPKIAGTYVVKNSRDKVVAQYYDKKKAQDHVNKLPKSGWKVEHVKEEEEIDEAKESWFDKHGIGTAGFNRSKRDEAARQSNKKEKAKAASARRRAEMSKKHPELAEEGQWGVDELGRFRRVDEAAGIARAIAKGANPLIKRPKFDARGNVILTRDAKRNIEYGKGPRSRKLTGRPFSTKKAFGEDKEIDEAEYDPIHTSGRRSKTRQARAKAGPNFSTVLVSPKGEKGAGKVRRIHVSQYDSKKHSLAEEQLDEDPLTAGLVGFAAGAGGAYIGSKIGKYAAEKWPNRHAFARSVKKAFGVKNPKWVPSKTRKEETEQLDEKNWIAGAIKKPGALTASAHRAKKSVGEFAREHKHSSGKVGKRARLALTLGKLRKEEAEQLDELKKDTLARYTKGAAKSMKKLGGALAGGFPMHGYAMNKLKNREQGIGRAADRLTSVYKKKNAKAMYWDTVPKIGEETKLNELGPETLRSYTRGAAKSMSKSASKLATGTPYVEKPLRNVEKRKKGIERATDRLGGTYETGKPLRVMIPGRGDNDKASGPYTIKKKKLYHGEETEQLDEAGLSKARLSSYIGPAKKSAESLMKVYQQKTKEVGPRNYSPEGLKSLHKAQRREKGIDQAQARIRGERRVPDSEINKRVEDEWAHPAKNFFKSTSKRVHNRYYKPYNVQEEAEQLDEVITKDTPTSDVIHDFVHSKNKVFSGDSKKQRIKRALGAYYGKQRGK